MEPISWTVIATLVAKYGIPFVEGLLTNIQNKTAVTAAEWNALTAKIDTSFDVLVPKQP